MDKVKLENIRQTQKAHPQHKTEPRDIFCRTCGQELVEEIVTEEYVCSGCRHLVGIDDDFCWFCGSKLEQTGRVEHYHRGKQLTDGEFVTKKAKVLNNERLSGKESPIPEPRFHTDR